MKSKVALVTRKMFLRCNNSFYARMHGTAWSRDIFIEGCRDQIIWGKVKIAIWILVLKSFEVKCRLFVWNKKVVDQFFPILASKPNFPKIFFLNDLMLRCASSRPSYGDFLLKVSTNVPTFHKWGARWRSLPTKECVKVSKK